jgi:hypothetical protein
VAQRSRTVEGHLPSVPPAPALGRRTGARQARRVGAASPDPHLDWPAGAAPYSPPRDARTDLVRRLDVSPQGREPSP